MHPEKFVAEKCCMPLKPVSSLLWAQVKLHLPASFVVIWPCLVGGMWSAIIFQIRTMETSHNPLLSLPHLRPLGKEREQDRRKLGLEWACKSAIQSECKSLGSMLWNLIAQYCFWLSIIWSCKKKKIPKEISIPNINVHGTHIEMRYFMWVCASWYFYFSGFYSHMI